MCFMPYLATTTAGVLVPHDQHPPGIALHPLRPGERAILEKFTLPHAAEVKLVLGCGCWLRHVDTSPHSATVEDIVRSPEYNPTDTQMNHDGLADYLEKHFASDGFVEFFGCYQEDIDKAAAQRLVLPLQAIRHRNFHFRLRAVYRLNLVH